MHIYSDAVIDIHTYVLFFACCRSWHFVLLDLGRVQWEPQANELSAIWQCSGASYQNTQVSSLNHNTTYIPLIYTWPWYSRVIRMDQGHALLVGVGGSGRQSLARLAAFAAGYEVFEITLSRGYGEEEFREDLKTLYHKLGLENKKARWKYLFFCTFTCIQDL